MYVICLQVHAFKLVEEKTKDTYDTYNVYDIYNDHLTQRSKIAMQ